MNDLQVTVVTALGALVILVAAWLLIMRRETNRNRAKFLGLELELSTPAIAVLLVGAGLLIGPAFAPYRSSGRLVPSFTDEASSGDTATSRLPQTSPEKLALLQPKAAEALRRYISAVSITDAERTQRRNAVRVAARAEGYDDVTLASFLRDITPENEARLARIAERLGLTP